MGEDPIRIRVATPADAAELLKIYGPYVLLTAISFEHEPPGEEAFAGRIAGTLKKYPYLVAEGAEGVLGYAYLSLFRSRPAYGWAAETTLYIRADRRGTGLGRRLYRALEGVAEAQNLLNLYACVATTEVEDEFLTSDSPRFHGHMGYVPVGELHRCGYKFGRWYNILWMEKMIGRHGEAPAAVIPFPELSRETLEKLGIDTGKGDR